jgi:hypothetical protein
VESLGGGGRQRLCGDQHRRTQLCPFAGAVEAFLTGDYGGRSSLWHLRRPCRSYLGLQGLLPSCLNLNSEEPGCCMDRYGTPPSQYFFRPDVHLRICSSLSSLTQSIFFIHICIQYLGHFSPPVIQSLFIQQLHTVYGAGPHQ